MPPQLTESRPLKSRKATLSPLVLQAVLLCFLAGCATQASSPAPRRVQGVFHVVKPGETLFRIGQTYNIPYQELARINRLRNPDLIRIGQRIFIPRMARPLAVEVASAAESAPEREIPREGQAGFEAEVSRGLEPSPEPLRVTQITESDVTQVTGPPSVPQPPEPLAMPAEAGDGLFLWPVAGTINSGFGRRGVGFHDGIDIAAPEGTPIRAIADGEVLYSDRLRGYGNIVIVRHASGFVSVYAHNQVNLVQEGESVSRGEVIALVGSTGRVTGPHLHFEIRKDNRPQDPLRHLPQLCCLEVSDTVPAGG